MGLGVGPLIAGPISELYGRNIVYRLSFALFFVFSIPVAFAHDIGTSNAGSLFLSVVHLIDPALFTFAAVFLVFRFVTGFCGAAFLSVSGGSVSDMFPNATVGTCVFSSNFFLDQADIEIDNSPLVSPMAVYTVSAFLGPETGLLFSGWA
jgi:MFS family permease